MELNHSEERYGKYSYIEKALNEAKKKHPNWPVDNLYKQVAILNEESGEVTKAVLKYFDEGGTIDDVKKELEQTGAMCMRMLENLEQTHCNGTD